MKFSLLDRLKKNAERTKPEVVTPNLSRLNLAPAEKRSASPSVGPEMAQWLERDLDLLKYDWLAFKQDPSRENWQAFCKAAHNLYGASGVYGGGTLTRLTENLQHLLKDQVKALENAALVNLHVQACQAWAAGNEEARTSLASAVCDALEIKVRQTV